MHQIERKKTSRGLARVNVSVCFNHTNVPTIFDQWWVMAFKSSCKVNCVDFIFSKIIIFFLVVAECVHLSLKPIWRRFYVVCAHNKNQWIVKTVQFQRFYAWQHFYDNQFLVWTEPSLPSYHGWITFRSQFKMPECVTMLGNHCCDQFTSKMNGFFREMEEINLFWCRKKNE